jgi:glutamyl/glutaminyl-tRNA synthetase
MIYNTRIAPSPTGFMHIGTARTAYFNYLAAKASGGKFILRIDDTDQNRNNMDAVKVIFDSMKWLGLDYDNHFFQSVNKDDGLYNLYADMLIKNDLAYKDDGAIKLRLPNDLPDSWIDSVSGVIPITQKDRDVISDMILIRSDGWPTYHFSTVVDDITHNINFVIRGNDHTTNTAKHIAIYKQLQKCGVNYITDIPKYAHVGLIHKNKKKMSKRDKDSDPTVLLSYYQDNGYDPDAVLNFLARMGWGPTVDDKTTSILTKDDMTRLFLDGGAMRSAPSNFDMDKLNSFDRKYKGRKDQTSKILL